MSEIHTHKMRTKKVIIEEIVEMLNNHEESISSFDMELDYSPCVNSIGNIVQLAESFDTNGIHTITYDDDVELREDNLEYDVLSVNDLEYVAENMKMYIDNYL